MPNLFETSFNDRALLAGNRAFGVSVTFTRGAAKTASFTARRSGKEHAGLREDFGLEVKITMRDFWLSVASIVLDGRTVAPVIGDRITEGSEVFEIQPPDDNKKAVELLAGGYEYLVHTKRVE